MAQQARHLPLTRVAALLSLVALTSSVLFALGSTVGPHDHASRFPSPSTATPDFTISATSPMAVHVNQAAISTIIINTFNSFVDPVAIIGNPSYGLTCGSITPPEVRGSGIASISCSATTAGEYNLTLTGTGDSTTHATNATFNFVDFKIVASSPTGAVGDRLSSTITIIAANGFAEDVFFSAAPQSGLTCDSIMPGDIMGSGAATISCSTTSIGEYTVTIHATSGSLTHSVNATFKAVNLPDFSITATAPMPVNVGQQTISTIKIEALDGFTDSVTFTDAIPSDLTCRNIIPTTLSGSGAATVSCSSNKAGTYTIKIAGSSNLLSHSATANFNFKDFSISAPSLAPSNVGSSTSSSVIIGSLNGFVGTISLTDIVPPGLTCDAIGPAIISNSGTAVIFCNAVTAGTYVLTVSATSSPLTHSVNSTFRFIAVFPDFSITATPSVSFASGSTGTSVVTISGQNNFAQLVMLSHQITPSTGLAATFNPATLYPGESTATFTSTTPGTYTVTITGTDSSNSHMTTVHVIVEALAPDTPDVFISMSVASLGFNTGASGTATITVAPQNGFTGTITLIVSTPSGISCSLSPTYVQTSGRSTLTCNSGTPGDYQVIVTGNGGAIPHTTTVNVHVATVLPSASIPSTILGLPQEVYSGILGVIIFIVVVETFLLLRRPRRLEP